MGYNIHYLKTARDKGSNPQVNIYILRTGYIDDLKIRRIKNQIWRGEGKTGFVGGGTCQCRKNDPIPYEKIRGAPTASTRDEGTNQSQDPTHSSEGAFDDIYARWLLASCSSGPQGRLINVP